MKHIYGLLCSLVLLLGTRMAKADTGFQALYTVAAPAMVELLGVHGQDQPLQWKVTLQSGYGQFTEVQTAQGRVVGSRPAPPPTFQGNAIGRNMLRYDSTHAFQTANAMAQRARLGFDSVNYRLRSNGVIAKWELQLVNVNGQAVGYLQISAGSGEVIDQQFYPAGSGYAANSAYQGGSGYGNGNGYGNTPAYQNQSSWNQGPSYTRTNYPQNYGGYQQPAYQSQAYYSPQYSNQPNNYGNSAWGNANSGYSGSYNGGRGATDTVADGVGSVALLAGRGIKATFVGIGRGFGKLKEWAASP